MQTNPLAVGEHLTLTIMDFTQKGQGIGRVHGLTIFVDDGVPGDTVRVAITAVKPRYGVGRIIAIETPSPDRITPDCPYFGECGGCQTQQTTYGAELRLKRKFVVDALSRIGGVADAEDRVAETLGMENPCRYRNKAQFKVDASGVGFYKRQSHGLIPIADCLNQQVSCRAVIAAGEALVSEGILTPYNEARHRGELRGIVQRTSTQGDEMLTLVVSTWDEAKAQGIIDFLVPRIPGLKSLNVNINARPGNTILGKETRCLWGEPRIEETLGPLAFSISPRSFFQVNTKQTLVLYQEVLKAAALSGHEVVYDLFCGTGTIGIFLAAQARLVVGIEVIADAVVDARENAARNGVDNAVFYCGKAEALVAQCIASEGPPDLVVLDPPRKGVDAHIIELIHHHRVPRVVYVSCNPATLARDVKAFGALGYALKGARPVDVFCRTGHVESVVLLSRTEGTTRAR